tara:strand:+ start:198 stop:392 length:195 start_codon:yes stop_codon:yes gene_type:complete
MEIIPVILRVSFKINPSKKNNPNGILMLANNISLIPGTLEIKGILSKIKLNPNNIKTIFIGISG